MDQDLNDFAALMGAFIDITRYNQPLFDPLGEDFSEGYVSSSDLFLVGRSLHYTAPQDGVLFFGIHEGFVSHNSGFLSVAIAATAVALLAGLPLLLAGLGGLWAILWRTRG